MNERAALGRLTTFLHLLAMGLFVGTIAELLSVKHWGESIRLVPFVLCGLGLLALATVWVRPDRPVVLGACGLMVVIALGSLLGVYEHVTGNLELVREVHRYPTSRQLWEATLTGRNPLLAPGTLAVAAVIAVAAMYARAGLGTTAAQRLEAAGLRSRRVGSSAATAPDAPGPVR